MSKTVSGNHVMASGFPAGAGGRPRGAVCFTFDDYHGGNWLNALPLFRKYNGEESKQNTSSGPKRPLLELPSEKSKRTLRAGDLIGW